MPHSHKIKKPKQSVRGKQYSYPVPESGPPGKDTPVFSLQYMEDSHCISQCSEEQKVSFVDKMRALSQLTWNQIKLAPKHGLGSEKIPRPMFKVPIPDFISEDEALLAIRFWNLAPMIGVRWKQIFHIIWFDKDFDVYDHGN